MGRWSIRDGGPIEVAWIGRDIAISLIAGLLLIPARGAEVVCMSTFLAGGIVGLIGIRSRRLHVVMIGLALAIVAAGCQAFTIPDVQRHSLLFAAAWAFIGVGQLMDLLAVSSRGLA